MGGDWQAYPDYLLSSCCGAALIGHQGGVWAQSGSLQIAAGEDTALGPRHTNFNCGAKINVGGIPYMATACNPDNLSGRKGKMGVVVAKSSLAYVVGVYDEGQDHSSGSAMKAVCDMADDLKSKNF